MSACTPKRAAHCDPDTSIDQEPTHRISSERGTASAHKYRDAQNDKNQPRNMQQQSRIIMWKSYGSIVRRTLVSIPRDPHPALPSCPGRPHSSDRIISSDQTLPPTRLRPPSKHCDHDSYTLLRPPSLASHVAIEETRRLRVQNGALGSCFSTASMMIAALPFLLAVSVRGQREAVAACDGW